MQQFVLQYVHVALGQEWPSLFINFSLARPNLPRFNTLHNV